MADTTLLLSQLLCTIWRTALKWKWLLSVLFVFYFWWTGRGLAVWPIPIVSATGENQIEKGEEFTAKNSDENKMMVSENTIVNSFDVPSGKYRGVIRR